MSPCCELNLIAEMLTPNASAAQLNLARADLRRVADKVKELEMFRLEMQKNNDKEADITERQARLSVSKVVPFRGKVPVYVVGQHVGPSEHNDLLAQTPVQKVEEIFRGGIEDPVAPGCEGRHEGAVH